MTTSIVRSGSDTWAWSVRPTTNYNKSTALRVQTAARHGYLALRSPVPRGGQVQSAILRLTQENSTWAGSNTITVQRITSAWKVGSLTWNNNPTVTTSGMVQVTKSGAAGRTVWEFDVTALVQLFANGTKDYGFRILSDSSVSTRHFYGLNAASFRPTLTVEWSTPPATPTALSPGFGVISLEKPVVRCDYTDLDGSSPLSNIQVQVDAAEDAVSPDFDSGAVGTAVPELDLAGTAYAGLANGATTSWRVRVQDAAGLWSGWSAWASFTRQDKTTPVITNPAIAPNDFVTEFTPPITWTFAGTQTAYQVSIVDAAAPQTVLATSGRVVGTDLSWTPPAGVLKDSRTYIAWVYVWDEFDREQVPNDPTYSVASRSFDVQFSALVDGVTDIAAAQVGDTPVIELTWDRATAPDSFTIERNGVAVAVDLLPGDLLVTGTSYRYLDRSAPPNEALSYVVRAVVAGVGSADTDAGTVEYEAIGFWLGNPATDEWFVVKGRGISWAHGEESATHIPLGSDHVVRIVTSMRGLEGELEGTMRATPDLTLEEQRAAVWAAKEHPARTYRLIAATINIPVVLGDVSMRPHEETRPGKPVEHVSLSFWQDGELPFEAEL